MTSPIFLAPQLPDAGQPFYIEDGPDDIHSQMALPDHLKPDHLRTDTRPGDFPGDDWPLHLSGELSRLIKSPRDPIGRQFLPQAAESDRTSGMDFEAWEKNQSPVPLIIRRYPRRVLFKVSQRCAAHCRYCFRKPFLKAPPAGDRMALIREALDYIQGTPEVHEVILSGGDPLMLRDPVLAWILRRLKAIPHVALYRIHTRVPVVRPRRITSALADVLTQVHPLYIILQCNHPAELTSRVIEGCQRLQAGGAILGSQSVLLRGVNDAPDTLAHLMSTLLAHGIRPYYLHQLDRVPGTDHFHVPLEEGIRIVSQLRRKVSGLAAPTYMLELPHGAGKIPLQNGSIVSQKAGFITLRTLDGGTAEVPG